MSVSIEVDIRDLDRALTRLAGLEDLDGTEALMRGIAAEGESQTRRRISEEKSGPDGQPWPPNRQGTPILVRTGEHLLGYMASSATSNTAEWGSSWEFAHVHQFGATIVPKNGEFLAVPVGGGRRLVRSVVIPPRPYLGLSADNAAAIVDLVTDFMGRRLR